MRKKGVEYMKKTKKEAAEKSKKKFSLKELKLAPKLTLIIGIALAIVFAVFIIVAVLMSKNALQKSIAGEMEAISANNANQTQAILNEAATVVDDMESYINTILTETKNDRVRNEVVQTAEYKKLYASDVLSSTPGGKTLTPANYDIEEFLVETARNAAKNNPHIYGVGVMYERYAFQYDVWDYSFYITAENADQDVTLFGTYEEYSAQKCYTEATAAGIPVVTEPYDLDGLTVVSYAAPIIFNDEIIGVVKVDFLPEVFGQIDATSDVYTTMYATIYDEDLTIIYDSNNTGNCGKSAGTFLTERDFANVKAGVSNGQIFEVTTTRDDTGVKTERFFTPVTIAGETWWAMTALLEQDMNNAVTTTVRILLIIAVLALAAIIVMTYFVVKTMLAPVAPIVAKAELISKGDFSTRLASKTKDELGHLIDIFAVMGRAVNTIIQDVDYQVDEMAKGNFCVETKHEEFYQGNYKSILESLRNLRASMNDTLGQINLASDQVDSGSDQVASGAQALSQGATEQASAVQELAATVNEINNHVHQTGQQASAANEKTQEAGRLMAQCDTQMHDMVAAMNEISHKSEEIGKIIKTIEDIAFQTNILALNAAVEAARAGSAGKGFAVVADEVRNLAAKSAEASKNTASLIEASMNAVARGAKVATDTAEQLRLAAGSAQEVSNMVAAIASAAQEQAASIEQVTTGIDQISSVVQTNSATAEESAAASEELSSQAQMLKDLVHQFKLADMEIQMDEAPAAEYASAYDAPMSFNMSSPY